MVVGWIKFLKKENKETSARIYAIIEKILKGDFSGLKIEPLEGYNTYFKCRVGKIKIIFYKENGKYFVHKIGYRGDVYKGL